MTELSADDQKLAIEVWKKTVDVQQHFNEICMKVRNLYVTLLAASVAFLGTVLARSEDPFFHVWGLEIHSGIVILITIFAVSLLFYFIDLHWYHRLLVGAVKNGLVIEKSLKNIPGIGLTTAIGDNSPIDLSERIPENILLYRLAIILRTDTKRVKENRKLHSEAKLAIFYKSIAYFSLFILILTCLSGGIRGTQDQPLSLPAEVPSEVVEPGQT